MPHNPLRERVLRGEPLFGAQIGFPSPELVELCCLAGFDYIFIDAEHGPIGWTECQAMVRACDAHGKPSIARVPTLDHSLIAKYLETGLSGVAVPHINTAAQAHEAAKAARYAPLGTRGCDEGSSRSSAYGLAQYREGYFAFSNREIIVAVWVEEVEGMKNLDEILQVPGVDAVNFGPGDLALSMGLPGQSNHPDVLAAVADGRNKALAAGKILIGEPSDADAAKKLMAEGAMLLNTSVANLLADAATTFLMDARRRV